MTILFPYMARWSSAHASRYYHLLTSVAELGHRVVVIQPPSRNSGEANDIDVALRGHPRVSVITVPFSRRFWNAKFPLEKLIKKLLFTLKSLVLVKRTIRREQVDLLYLYNLPQFVYLIGRRPRVVFDFADDLLGMLETELSITPRHPIYRLASACLNWIVRRSDLVICISGPLYDAVHHRQKFIIPNGAPLGVPEMISAPLPASVPGGPLTVGYVGAFEYSMNLDQVLDVAARLPQVRFLLVGAGREFPRIQSEVVARPLPNVILTGALPHDEAMRRIDGMDICLNLFHKTKVSHAVSPLKLFEYLAHHKPVISTRLDEVNRINEGFLFFGDTVDEVVEAIASICAHPEAAHAMAEKGHQIVRTRFAWPVIAREFLGAVALACGSDNLLAEKK